MSSLLRNTFLIDADYGLLFDKTITHAKEEGCTTIVITDNEISPIAQLADYVLTSKYEIPSFFHSNICALALIDCIVAGVSREKTKID